MSPEARFRLLFCLAFVATFLFTADVAFGRRRTIPHTPLPPGPGLQEIVDELQKPLPPLDQSDARHVQTLAQPPELITNDTEGLRGRALGLAIYGSLLVFAWFIALGKLPSFAVPSMPAIATGFSWPRIKGRPHTEAAAAIARKPPQTAQVGSPGGRGTARAKVAPPPPHATAAWNSAPEPLSNAQIIHYKALSSFDSWKELLTAARAGNRVAREVLDHSPGHAAVRFQLTAIDFTRHFAYARNVVLSRAWVNSILSLLRATESFDANLAIVSPFGRRQELPLDAPIDALNAVLGYESLPQQVRRQLELRRWILWQTRTDGAENTEILAAFAAPPPFVPAPSTADALAAKAAAAMRS